jgi:hypothetical protein
VALNLQDDGSLLGGGYNQNKEIKMFKFNLGDEVKDSITGFNGTITVRTEFLNGCIRYGVQCKKLSKDGVPRGVEYFDEQQLSLVKAKPIIEKKKRPGGPAPITPKYNS